MWTPKLVAELPADIPVVVGTVGRVSFLRFNLHTFRSQASLRDVTSKVRALKYLPRQAKEGS